MSLVLASASAARAKILRDAGVCFEALPAAIDEGAIKSACIEKGLTASEIAIRLAAEKALQISSKQPDRHVVGADQILALDGEIVSKCGTIAEARSLLGRLRGRKHELVTAAVLASGGKQLWHCVTRCRLVMREFTDTFVADYFRRTGSQTVQSLGCYQMEGLGVQLFERIDGDHFSILGLPLIPLLAAMRAHGLIQT